MQKNQFIMRIGCYQNWDYCKKQTKEIIVLQNQCILYIFGVGSLKFMCLNRQVIGMNEYNSHSKASKIDGPLQFLVKNFPQGSSE